MAPEPHLHAIGEVSLCHMLMDTFALVLIGGSAYVLVMLCYLYAVANYSRIGK